MFPKFCLIYKTSGSLNKPSDGFPTTKKQAFVFNCYYDDNTNASLGMYITKFAKYL